MNIITVAKNDEIAFEISETVKEVFTGDMVLPFNHPLSVCQYATFNQVDMAIITDEQKRPMNCMSLAEWLRKKYPDVKVVFITNNEAEWDYAKQHIDCGNICWPVTRESVMDMRQAMCF